MFKLSGRNWLLAHGRSMRPLLDDEAPGAWRNAFLYGTTATGAFNVTLSGTQTASGVTFEEGTVTLVGDGLDLTGTGVIDVVGTRTGSINSN